MKIDLTKISTEQRNENTKSIDSVSTVEMLTILNKEDQSVPIAISKVIEPIAELVEKTTEAIKNGGRIIYIGAGTSGRLGILDASEMPPTYNVEKGLFIGLIAGGQEAIQNPVENAEDSEEAAVEDMKEINFSSKDVLIGIAASGRTPYVVAAIKYAKSLGAVTGAISTSKDSLIGQEADIKIEPLTGPEPITGSTRMKSGTAQKLVLNMISTGTMIKLGKVYGNLMVDVVPLNSKLKVRAHNIVRDITNADDEVIEKALLEAEWNVKNAIVMVSKGISVEEAEKMLEENSGVLRKIL